MNAPLPNIVPLESEFASDDEMKEILQEYLEGLPAICSQLTQSLSAGDLTAVRRIGHQMKGSGGGYGYPQLTEAGAKLEKAAASSSSVNDELLVYAETLVLLCHRAHASLGR